MTEVACRMRHATSMVVFPTVFHERSCISRIHQFFYKTCFIDIVEALCTYFSESFISNRKFFRDIIFHSATFLLRMLFCYYTSGAGRMNPILAFASCLNRNPLQFRVKMRICPNPIQMRDIFNSEFPNLAYFIMNQPPSLR